MAIWADWLPDILPHVQECPIPVVEHEVRRAAQEFLGKTRAWKLDLAAMSVSSGNPNVTLSFGAETVLAARIEAAWLDGAALEIVPLSEMSSRFGSGWNADTGTPTVLVPISPSSVRLYPIPNAAATTGLTATIAAIPNEVATGIQEDIATQYRNTIATGAKARLMLYPGKPWQNPDLAAVNNALFQQEIDTGISAVATAGGSGRVAATTRWC